MTPRESDHKQALLSTLQAGLAALPSDAMRRAFVSGAYAEIVGYDALADGWTYEEALDTIAELMTGENL